jgi:uncharacterized membrane protein YkoI
MPALITIRLLVFGILLITGISSSAWAGDDHDRARKLVEQGDILPLETILQKLPPDSGKVLEVELEHEHGQLVYEIELLHPDGRVREYTFSAIDGKLVGVENED